jgi:hypothetical protein
VPPIKRPRLFQIVQQKKVPNRDFFHLFLLPTIFSWNFVILRRVSARMPFRFWSGCRDPTFWFRIVDLFLWSPYWNCPPFAQSNKQLLYYRENVLHFEGFKLEFSLAYRIMSIPETRELREINWKIPNFLWGSPFSIFSSVSFTFDLFIWSKRWCYVIEKKKTVSSVK